MKITHAIIKDGISYGIPERTKVPEKPTLQSMTCDEDCKGECGDVCPVIQNARMDNEAEMSRYNTDIQALLSVAIQWEDQRMIKSFLPETAFVENENVGLIVGMRDGIYPLLGVEADEVEQFKVKGDKYWIDGVNYLQRDKKYLEFRFVLRLIPQHNSEQKMKCPACGSLDIREQGPSELMEEQHLICYKCKAEFDEIKNTQYPPESQSRLFAEVIMHYERGEHEQIQKKFTITRNDL